MGIYDAKKRLAQPSNAIQFETANKKVKARNVLTDKAKKKFMKELASDDDVKKAYAEELIPKVDLNVWATMIASEFFNIGTVSIGDPMYYQLDFEVDPDTAIRYKSTHGGNVGETFVTDGETVRIHPYFIQTPQVHMNKRSLKQGDITTESKMRRKMERNMSKRIDKDMWDVAKTNLVDSGASETLVGKMGIELDDDIKNFPETNNIDASAEGGLTLNIFKKIADYANRVGNRVRNIYVPSNRMSDIYDWVSIPSGYSGGTYDAEDVVPSYLQDQIVRTGQLNALFGYEVNLVPVNFLDGTEGNADNEIELFVSFDAPAGEYRDIRELDDVFEEEDAARLYYTATKGIALFTVPYQAANICRIVFDSFSG